MRNPTRIPILLSHIQHLWEKHPDLRFGQLLFLIDGGKTGSATPFFYAEDENLLKRIREVERELEEKHKRDMLAWIPS